MILCVTSITQPDDKLYYLLLGAGISFMSSFFVSWYIYYLNKKKENEKENREIKAKLRNEIFTACDKLIRYSILVEHYALQFRLYERLKTLEKGTDEGKEDEILCWKYSDLAEDAGLKHNLCKNDLVKNVYDLFIYWNEKSEVLIPLINEAKAFELRNFSGLFSNARRDEISLIFFNNYENITNYNIKEGIGKSLIKIQKEIAPPGMKLD